MTNLNEIAANLELRNGIWHSKNTSPISYPEYGNDMCFQVEEESFWFNHRNNCILELVKNYPAGEVFLDVGGGNGFVSLALQQAGYNPVLIEPGNGVINAKIRGIKNIACTSLQDARFKPDIVSGIGLFDVLEHIEDDENFLLSLYTILKQNGRLYITVPAYKSLWSYEDKIAGHYKRYTLSSITKKLSDGNFMVEYATYFFSFLPIPIFLFRSLKGKISTHKKVPLNRYKKEHKSRQGLAGVFLRNILNYELNKIKNRQKILWGSSCLLVAKK